MDTLSEHKNDQKRSQIRFTAVLRPTKSLNSSFGGDLRPVLTTDLKSTIKELSESYWHVFFTHTSLNKIK